MTSPWTGPGSTQPLQRSRHELPRFSLQNPLHLRYLQYLSHLRGAEDQAEAKAVGAHEGADDRAKGL